MKIDVIIPTYKPDDKLIQLISKLNSQTVKPDRIILINTEKEYYDRFLSVNDIPSCFENVEVTHITKSEFDHGHTRNEGMKMSDGDISILMTMDAVPYDDKLIEELIKPLSDENIASAYGRQMAFEDSSITEKLTRSFNYPEQSCIKSAKDIERLQIKAFFCSNVCCAYKMDVFNKLGGFVNKTIFNEDMLYAFKVINSGYSIAYAADARVYHSHEYSGMQQFHRNFDNGVSHAEYPDVFGGIKQEGEGMRMVKTVIAELVRGCHFIQIIRFVWCTGWKFIGFKLGCRYKKLPMWMVKSFTATKSYFE